MKVTELKALTGDSGLRNYSRMRKAELVALLQTNGASEGSRALHDHSPPLQSGGPRAPTPRTRPFPPPPQRHTAYVILKIDDNRCCRIHSISDDGNGWIVTNERCVVMPWKMVTRHGKNMGLCTAEWGKASGPSPCEGMTLTEAVDSIFSQKRI